MSLSGNSITVQNDHPSQDQATTSSFSFARWWPLVVMLVGFFSLMLTTQFSPYSGTQKLFYQTFVGLGAVLVVVSSLLIMLRIQIADRSLLLLLDLANNLKERDLSTLSADDLANLKSQLMASANAYIEECLSKEHIFSTATVSGLSLIGRALELLKGDASGHPEIGHNAIHVASVMIAKGCTTMAEDTGVYSRTLS